MQRRGHRDWKRPQTTETDEETSCKRTRQYNGRKKKKLLLGLSTTERKCCSCWSHLSATMLFTESK